ncbi:SDR family oxidoreductase [Kineosporia sp. A_224]|uniref:SDR family oxidoreductase n=1 Tax=Kineosporia sp. A_224 TaxID=1962180 RepID=UPI001E315637|nr:SDR family oxidoreductase [Kineosporia sp. A_224]
MRRRRSVSGLVVAITGAANGIGLETATRFARAGASVAIGDLDGAAARSAAHGLGGRALGIELDVTDTASFSAFLDEVETRIGPLDVLVNNAGVMWVGPFGDEPEHVARRQVDVNLLGAMRGVRLAAPGMVARGRGCILTVASAASIVSPPGESTYAATKHGIHGYLKGVRRELRGTGVDICVVLPTVVDTALAAGTKPGGVPMLRPADVAAAVVATVERPRFEVFVPGRVRALGAATGLLPRGLRDLVERLLVPDQVVAVRADEDARRGYESGHFG